VSPGAGFEKGDAVFLASAGLGRVVDFAGRAADGKPAPLTAGAEPAFYVVEVEDTVALVPLGRAETLRRPVSADDARAMLEALRATEPPPSPAEPLLERGKRVVHSGTPLEHSRFLRELCALPVPVAESVASGITFLSKLVLPEISSVLGLSREQLETELQQRFPAARDARDQAALLRFR